MKTILFVANWTTAFVVGLAWGFWWGVLALIFAPVFWIYFGVKAALPLMQRAGLL